MRYDTIAIWRATDKPRRGRSLKWTRQSKGGIEGGRQIERKRVKERVKRSARERYDDGSRHRERVNVYVKKKKEL